MADVAETYSTGNKTEEKSLEQLTKEHSQRRTFLSGLIEKVTGREEYTMDNMRKITEKYDTKLSEAGINVEHVPDIAKPYWIRLVNIVKNPENRFKDAKKGLDTYILELKGLEEDMTKELYGTGYTSLQNEPGGLYGKVMEFGGTRQEYANAILELEKECSGTNTRIEDIKEKIKNSSSPTDKLKYNKEIIRFKFDQTTYEKHKRDLIGKIRGVDLEIKSTKENMKQLESFQIYVNSSIGQADEVKLSYNTMNRDIDYTKKITGIIPNLDKQLQMFREIGEAFNESNYNRQVNAAKVTNFELKKGKNTPNERPSPFADCVKKKEEENEAIMQRVREINDNPMGDIFDN